MNKKNIDKALTRAINQAPTLNFEDLVNTPFIKMTEQDYITRQPEKHIVNHRRQVSVAFAFCFVILLSFSGWYMQYRVPDSIISLDVNPSIEIVTNKQDRIISMKALNEDAKKVIDEQTGKTTDLTLAVSSLLTEIINQGYLNTDKNAIMISVENKNQEKARELAISLEDLIKIGSTSQNITPEVLKQVITENKDASELALQYHLSVGKLKLIQQILSFDNTLSMDSLASMSIEELLDMSEERNVDLHEIIEFDDDSSEAENDSEDSKTQENQEKEDNSLQSDEGKYDTEESEYNNDEEEHNNEVKEKLEVNENKREDTEDKEDADYNNSTVGDSRGESDDLSQKSRDESRDNTSKSDSSDDSEDSSKTEYDESDYNSSQDDSTDIGVASSVEEDGSDIRTPQGDSGDDREDTSKINTEDNKNNSSYDENDD